MPRVKKISSTTVPTSRVNKTHPGFKKIKEEIAKKYGSKAAGAILAGKTRKVSKEAKKKNPNLKRVKG